MARKQPPPGFDPHPGDPWHPDWALSDESKPEAPEMADPSALIPEQGGDADWWQRALARQDDTGEPAQVPEAYASLEAAVTEEPDLASEIPEPADAVQGSWWKRRFGRAARADPPEDQTAVPVAAEPAPELELQAAAAAEAEAVLAEAEAEAVLAEAIVEPEPEVAEPAAELEPIAAAVVEPEPEVAEPAAELEPEVVGPVAAAVVEPEPEVVGPVAAAVVEPEPEVVEPVAELEPEVAALVEHLVEDLTIEAEVVEGRRPDVDVQLAPDPDRDAGPALDAAPAPEVDDEVIEDLVSELGSEPAVVEGIGVDLDETAALDPALDQEVAGLVEHLVEDLKLEAEVVEGRRPDVDVQLVATAEPEPQPVAAPQEAVIEDLLTELGSEAAVVEDAGTDPDSEQELVSEPGPHPDRVSPPETAPELAALVEEVVADLEHGAEFVADVAPEPVAPEPVESEPELGLVGVDEEPELEGIGGLESGLVEVVEPALEPVELEPALELVESEPEPVESEPELGLVGVDEEPELEGIGGLESGLVEVVEPAPELVEPEPEPAPELVEPEPAAPELETAPQPDEEELATKAADRVYRIASSIAAEDSLQAADSSHREDARMRAAIAEVREKHVLRPEEADDLEARQAERMAVREALAAEVRRIEAARQEVEESVRRTAAEVRSTLDGHRQSAEDSSPTLQQPINDIGATFAAIAADQKAFDEADLQRMERREQLRLRTSLLVVDADQPWAAQGWSRPGSLLGGIPPDGREALPVAAAPVVASFDPIDTASAPTVPESAPRRRWSWSRKRNPPTSPNTPQDTMRHVVVVKEQSVSGREGEPGEDGQDALPFDDAASPAPETNGDLEDLAAWSDMDWDFDTSPTTPAEDSPGGMDSPDPEPFSEDSVDASPETESADTASPDMESPDTWESFTADDYVQTATHEYADLAAAVAAAETEEPEQAALSVDMPGLESSLVSLDDVVAAQGMERAAAAPDRSDLAIRALTAIGLIALFFASLTYRWSIRLLVLVVMTVAAGELAISLTRRGYHPVGLFSYLGTVGALVGTWIYGPVAIPVAVAATILVVVLFFGLVTGRQDPLVGMALTVVTVMWVGVFGAFAYDLIEATEYRWLVAALVIIVAGMDVASYFVGKRFGKRLLAPVVSPKKTVAGLVGGVTSAVAIGFGLSFLAPFDWPEGLVLGAALAVTGPLGDLAVSVLKRAMQVKDMGTILPGHGGVVDRIDAILFSIPAAWAVYAWAGLLV